MPPRKRFITAVTLLLGGSAALIIATAGLQWMKAYLNRECIFMEVRLAEREPRVGLEPAQVPGTGAKVFLHPKPIVTSDDVTLTYVTEGIDAEPVVGVELSEEGAVRLAEATGENMGRMAAVLLDGEVVLAAEIRSRISESMVIGGDFTAEEARRFASDLCREGDAGEGR